MRVRGPVVPAYAGTSNPCLRFDVGAVREPPEGHAIPNVSPIRRQLAHCAIPAPPLHWLYVSFMRRTLVVPAKARTSNPCLRFGVGAVREPPEGHAIPNVSPNPTTTAHCAIAAPALHWLYASFTRLPPVVPAKAETSHPCPLSRHSSEGWNPGGVRVRTTGNATKCNQMQLN